MGLVLEGVAVIDLSHFDMWSERGFNNVKYNPHKPSSIIPTFDAAGGNKQTPNNNKQILLKCLAKWNQNSHSRQFHKYIN